MSSDAAIATELLTKSLLGACVESFGLAHQVLFIEFRDNSTNDHLLSIDTEIISNLLITHEEAFSNDERALLLFHKVNLKSILEIQCDADGTLTIHFEGGAILIFNGLSADESTVEPWQIGSRNSFDDGGYLVVAMRGGGYAVWDCTPKQ